MIDDPLANLQIEVNSYDIPRKVTIYTDKPGQRWWTKAWFNGREQGEDAVPITRQNAIAFIRDEIKLDDWLSRFFPKQMAAIYKARENTRNQLLEL